MVLRQIRYVAQRIEIQTIAVVFVEKKQILPRDMIHTVKEYSFAYLPITKGEKNTIKNIVSYMYKNNIRIRKKRYFSAFYKFDSPLL